MNRFLLLISLVFSLNVVPLRGADYYWVGNSGDWTNLSNWVVASGSTTNHTVLPGINDDIYFDNNSFSAPNQVVTLPQSSILTNSISINRLNFSSIGSLQPTIQGGRIIANGNVKLDQNVRILSEFYSSAQISDINIEVSGGYFRYFVTSGTTFKSIIVDSLICGTLVLSTANLEASNVSIRADTIKNFEVLSPTTIQHLVDFNGSYVFVKLLELKSNLFMNMDWSNSRMFLEGEMRVCGRYDFHIIQIDSKGKINNTNNSNCVQSGQANFTIDSLFIGENSHLEIISDSSDKRVLEIEFLKSKPNSTISTNRILEIIETDIGGQLNILNETLSTDILVMRKSSELVLEPTVGSIFRMRVRAQWDIEGECSDKIYVRSSEYGKVSRVDVSAFMKFDYAQIVDIEMFGAGPQQIENSIKAGKTSGINLIGITGRKYFWVGNAGNWQDPMHWSLTDGGVPGSCVPGILDTVVFTNNSFDASGYKVQTLKNILFVRHFECNNNNTPFEFEGNSTRLYIIGSALFRKNIQFTNPTSLYLLGSSNIGELNLAGEQNISKLEISEYTTFNLNLNSDSLLMPNCEMRVYEGVSLVTTGVFLQTKNTILNKVESSFSLEEFRTGKLFNLGDSDNVFNSQSTILYVSDEGRFEGDPVSISSLRYSGEIGCFVNLFDKLDTIRFERPAAFYTYTDTIISPNAPKSFWVFFNELGLAGLTKIKGVESLDGLVIGNSDYRDCEFDVLTVANVRKMTLSGNLRINKRFRNNSNCNLISYFMKNEDSLANFYQFFSNSDTIILEGFHIYSIDAVGSAKFIAQNGKDMGNNSGWIFTNQTGRKYYWIGKTGNYINPSNWSLTSNGSPTTCIPSLLDTVIYDRFSFSSLSDTVYLPNYAIPVRSWIVQSDIIGLPVFHAVDPSILYVKKDFKQLAPTSWSKTVRVSFLTSMDTSRISNKYQSPNIVLAMGHSALFNRFILEDTLRVRDIWMGFGTFLANGKPIYAESFVADTAVGYAVGEVRGFSIIKNTYMEVDRLNAFQKFGVFGFLRGRADMLGTTIQCRSFNMSFIVGGHPQKVEFLANIDGFLRIGEDGNQGGRIDSVIAHGNLTVLPVDTIMPLGYLKADYLIVDGFFNAHAPLDVTEAFIKNDAYFKTYHDFEMLILTKNKTYEFDPSTILKYNYIEASSSSCEPITIIGKKSGGNYFIQKNQGGIFNGQGVKMRDCVSVGGTTYMGTQATDLGNNVAWVVGRPPGYNLVDLSKDFVLCENDSILIDGQMLYQNGLEYIWKIDNNQFFPGNFGFFLAKSGLYTLEVKYTSTCSLYDTAYVDVFTKDRLDLGNDTMLCQGGYVALTPNIESDWTFTWSTGSRLPYAYLYTGGTYWLKVTNAAGCTVADSVDVGFFMKPKNPAGVDTTVCTLDNYLTGKIHKGFSYEWSTGETTPQISVGNGGVFTLKMGNGICYVEDTVIINVDNPIYFSIGSDTVLLEGENYTLSPDKNLPNYYWNTGDSTQSIIVNQDSLYILETRKGACETFDSAWVRFRKMPNVYFEKDTIFLCEGETTDLKPIVSQPVLSYLWNTGSIDSILLNQGIGGMYIIEVKDSFFTNSDSIYLFVQDSFKLDLGNDTALCIGEKVTIQSNEIANTYIWNTGSTIAQIEVDISGLYKLEIEKDYCKAMDSIYVDFQPVPFVELLADTLVCEDESVSVNISKPGYNYIWNDGNTSPQRTFNQAGLYTVTVSQGVCQDIFSTTITHQSKPEFFLGNDTAICDNIPLSISAQRSFAKSYMWENGFDGPNRTITEAGVYGVYLNDGICEVYDEIQVSKLKTPSVDLGSDTSICNGEFLELIPTVSQISVNYLWSDGTTSDRLIVNDTGTYILRVDNDFCFDSDTILVYSCDCNVIYIPNAFSPNSDGLNDGFRPSDCNNISTYKLQVFNRWGQVVFETTNPQEEWDGTNNGNECPGGAYLYKLFYNAQFENGSRNRDYNLTGTVNLIR